MRNMLGEASSPYLQQHKDNPVHWQVWGPAALAAASARDVPILLSIGYAACHWCHVMAHESFEDPAVAALMNENFVNIKVDREERPDIDQIFMTALQAMGEQGGWPLTMVLTPAGDAFWGGTYFPPEPRFGRPSFSQVLTALAQAWTADKDKIGTTVVSMNRALETNFSTRPGAAPGPDVLDRIRAQTLQGVDWAQGGLGTAPKFPNVPVFLFLWQEYFRTGDVQCEAAVEQLVAAMCKGGIYDHLGGGFSRYATDSNWLIPHFEKMLYDNALILELLALAAARTNNPLVAARARETVAWLVRDMRAEGAFAASEDADSEGVEGKFYVWTAAEIEDALGADAAFFAKHYDIPAQGNWEHKIILERISPLQDDATEIDLASCRALLLQRRAARIRPGRDDKILADWNALTVSALARASAVFAEPGWLTEAAAAFDFLLDHLGGADGRIAHAYRDGKISAAGLLDDQAAMIRAALALFEATGAPSRLLQAEAILTATETYFSDGAGAFFMAANDATDVPGPRSRVISDGPTPSGIGMMAGNYARLYHLTGAPKYRAAADAVLASYGGRPELLAGSPTLLAAADFLENAACVVIIGGDPILLQTALAVPDPAVVVLQIGARQILSADHPAYSKDTAGAFVCRGGVCALPVTTAAELAALCAR